MPRRCWRVRARSVRGRPSLRVLPVRPGCRGRVRTLRRLRVRTAIRSSRMGQPTVGPGYQAVLRFRAADGSEQQLIRRSAPGTPHPEWQMLHELRAMGVPPQQVIELHTELESCELPGGYCARMIRETWPQVRITSVAPYGTDHASRRAGDAAFADASGRVAPGGGRPGAACSGAGSVAADAAGRGGASGGTGGGAARGVRSRCAALRSACGVPSGCAGGGGADADVGGAARRFRAVLLGAAGASGGADAGGAGGAASGAAGCRTRVRIW